MSDLVTAAKKWARAYLDKYPNKFDEAIEGAKNWIKGYCRAFGGEIPEEVLEVIEKQLREELNRPD